MDRKAGSGLGRGQEHQEHHPDGDDNQQYRPKCASEHVSLLFLARPGECGHACQYDRRETDRDRVLSGVMAAIRIDDTQ